MKYQQGLNLKVLIIIQIEPSKTYSMFLIVLFPCFLLTFPISFHILVDAVTALDNFLST